MADEWVVFHFAVLLQQTLFEYAVGYRFWHADHFKQKGWAMPNENNL